MNESDKQFEDKAKRLFDESVDGLDAATLSRLNRGRQAALAAARRPSAQWSRWIPATGVAAAVLVAVLVMRAPGEIDAPDVPQSAMDFEILLEEDSIDMFEELEFYSWLDTDELDADGDVG